MREGIAAMTRTEHERKIRLESMRIAPIPLASLVCEDCGNPKVMAVTPGQDAQVVSDQNVAEFGVWPAGLIVVRAVPPRGWCLACSIRRGWLTESIDKSKPYRAIS